MGFNDINHLKKDACLIDDTEMCEGFIVITSTYTEPAPKNWTVV